MPSQNGGKKSTPIAKSKTVRKLKSKVKSQARKIRALKRTLTKARK